MNHVNHCLKLDCGSWATILQLGCGSWAITLQLEYAWSFATIEMMAMIFAPAAGC
jgi:hypothetical protein